MSCVSGVCLPFIQFSVSGLQAANNIENERITAGAAAAATRVVAATPAHGLDRGAPSGNARTPSSQLAALSAGAPRLLAVGAAVAASAAAAPGPGRAAAAAPAPAPAAAGVGHLPNIAKVRARACM